jgi:hypothetical protein
MSRWKIIEVKANEYKVVVQVNYIAKGHTKEQVKEAIEEGVYLDNDDEMIEESMNVIDVIEEKSGAHIEYQVTDTVVLDKIKKGIAEERETICYHTYDKQEALKWVKEKNNE